MLRTLLTRRAGQSGTKKLMRRYGADLVCVRYRYDDERQERMKTVEVVLEQVRWDRKPSRDPNESVAVKLDEREDLLRRAVLFAGGRWNESTDTWTLSRRKAEGLGLESRIRDRKRGKGTKVNHE